MPPVINNAGTSEFFKRFPDSRWSAGIILPLLFEMIGTPTSMVDLGGGVGSWSQVAKELGVARVLCIDHPGINRSELLIEEREFIASNLSEMMPDPVKSELAICLEVAEHIPHRMSRSIVQFLTASAPIVLFSASIPGQPGLDHINEQGHGFWRALFFEAGYQCWDVVRPRIIDNVDIPYWYRQNIFVFAAPVVGTRFRAAQQCFAAIPADFALVHENVLRTFRHSLETPGFRRWLRILPAVVRETWKRRVHAH